MLTLRIDKPGTAELILFDAEGVRVGGAPVGRLAPGEREFPLPAAGSLPGGRYYARVVMDGRSACLPITLVK